MKKDQLTIIKIGGKVLENQQYLSRFLENFLRIEGKKLLVHGGGVLADQLLKERGIEPVMKNGRRVTDEKTLETVVMVYGGLVNKKIVAALAGHQISAVGMTGADGMTVTSVKRPSQPVDYGYAGDVVSVNITLPEALLQSGQLPVIAPLSMTKDGQLLNTNADTMAAMIAIAFAGKYAVNLVYGFEIQGVMADVANPASLIKTLDAGAYKKMISEGTIYSGMIPKLDNAFMAAAHAEKTLITHYGNVDKALDNSNDQYTLIR